MASIRKQPNGRWKVTYWGPDRRQHAQRFNRKIDAERFAATVEADKLRGSWVDPAASQITVAAWWTTWRATKVDLRPSALARLDSTVKTHVLPEWGRLPLQGISNAAVRAWIARMVAAGMSASSVRKAHFALHQMLQAAVADRKLAFDPGANVPLPPERHGEQRFLSADEVATLENAMAEVERATAERTGRGALRRFEADGSRYRALVLVAAYGGLRFGEIAALRRRRVDLLRGRLTVAQTLVDLNGELSFGPPKTKNGRRTVPLPRRVVRELAAHVDAHVGADPDALVFTNTRGGPLRRAGFRRNWWQPAVRKAGLDPLSFHDYADVRIMPSEWLKALVGNVSNAVRSA